MGPALGSGSEGGGGAVKTGSESQGWLRSGAREGGDRLMLGWKVVVFGRQEAKRI